MHHAPLLSSAWRVRLSGALAWMAFTSLATAANVSFDVPDVRLWLNEKQILPFQCTATPAKRVFETSIEPAGMAEILLPGTVLDGEKTGFLRIRPLKTGRAILHVGDATLHVDIKNDLAAEFSGQKEPRIISPVAGAYVYGTVSVGVEIPMIDPGSPDPKVSLVVGDGTQLQPRAQTLPVTGADRIYAFDVNADQFAAGPVRLQAVSEDQTGIKRQSEPIYVAAFRPDPSAVLEGACADHMDATRPQRYGDKWPLVLKDDPNAPEGYVVNKSPEPAWLLSETLPEAGYYQMFLRARGDAGGGSFPSIGLIVDEKDKTENAVRLVDTAWQRVALGRPVFLEAGEHILATKFQNKFGVGQNAQRNLYLERFELVRVSKADSGAPAGDPEMSMMMESGTSMMKEGADASALLGVEPLRVAFTRPFDGQVVDGPVRVSALAWWQNGLPAPSVDLILNGNVVQTQYGSDLDFHLPAQALKSGKNILHLRASLGNGITADSPEQTVILPAVPVERTATVPRMLRYGVFAPGWDPSLAQRFEKQYQGAQPVSAVFYNGESSLSLPDNLTGDFQVRLDAHAQDNYGAPVALCELHTGENSVNVGQAPVAGMTFHTVDLGKVHLDQGPKQLIIRYAAAAATPQTQAPAKGKTWSLKAVRLEEVSAAPLNNPNVSVDYAPAKVSSAEGSSDAVVARCFAQDGIRWADLVIDGKAQDIQMTPRNGLGRLVFPVLARSLMPGAHTLQVQAMSQGGKQSMSPAQTFTVFSTPIPPVNNRYARAVHLLNRFGYGPEPEEVADILVNGEESWLRDRLSRTWDDPSERAVMAYVRVKFPDEDHNDVVSKSLLQLLLTRNPVRARFTLWAENHFSTWMQKTQPQNKWPEHQRFLELGVAPFRDLLFASATSPAMLIYLDQYRSFAGRLNENYAREIMELHTVGVHGGYTQSDVTSLASILTGWTLSQDAPLAGSSIELSREFRYEPMADSPAAKRVFGMEFPETPPEQRYDRTHSALEMLASHPSAARFISEKLAQHYVGVPAPQSLVDRLTNVFEEKGGDMAEMLVTIANSPEFWATMNQPRFATPFDYSLRLCRMTGGANAGAVAEFLRKSGTGLFDRVTPDGFPETDASYADSNAMLQRWNFAKSIQNDLRSLVPQSLTAKQSQWSPALQEQMLDIAAARLLGQPLNANSWHAAWGYLTSADVAAASSDHVLLTTSFLAQLPENNLR